MRTNRKSTLSQESIALFRECCETVREAIGDSPFKIPGAKNAVNKALFDAIMISVAFSDRKSVVASGPDIIKLIATLHGDESFRTSIGRATADRFRMFYRINAVAQGFRTLGISVDLPENLGLEA